MDGGDPRVYVINLDKDTVRLAKVTEELKREGLSEFERTAGVYGKELSKVELRRRTTALARVLSLIHI